MSPELSALARYLAEIYRDHGSMVRLVEQSGLDAAKLPLQNTTPANAWFAIVELAVQEDRLVALLDLVRTEKPRNQTVGQLWDAYLATPETAPPREWINYYRDYDDMEQQQNARLDGRVDALQRDVADLRATVARLETMLGGMAEQNKMILAQLNIQHGGPLSNTLLSWIALALFVGALAIFTAIYLGGHT